MARHYITSENGGRKGGKEFRKTETMGGPSWRVLCTSVGTMPLTADKAFAWAIRGAVRLPSGFHDGEHIAKYVNLGL
jgi:hypothetical protein